MGLAVVHEVLYSHFALDDPYIPKALKVYREGQQSPAKPSPWVSKLVPVGLVRDFVAQPLLCHRAAAIPWLA